MPEPTTPTTAGAALAAAEALAHRHHWIFDGTQVGGMLIYHCDDHDDLVRRYGQRFSAAREADLLAMSTPTTPEAALAAALRFNADPPYLYVASDTEGKFDYPAWAAAILAAMPDWTLIQNKVLFDANNYKPAPWYAIENDRLKGELAAARLPRVATADWTGSTRKEAEIARLRAALEEIKGLSYSNVGIAWQIATDALSPQEKP